MSYAQLYHLAIGDRIIAPLAFTIKHFAIYIGFIDGQEYLAQNTANYGTHIIPADDFFAEHGECFVKQFIGSIYERQQIVYRATQSTSRPYNFLTFNCEHYANYLQYGTVSSPQVIKGLLLGVGVLALYNR